MSHWDFRMRTHPEKMNVNLNFTFTSLCDSQKGGVGGGERGGKFLPFTSAAFICVKYLFKKK